VEVHLHSFLTSALDGGEWSASRRGHSNPRRNSWVVPESVCTVWIRGKHSAPAGIRTLDHPFHSVVSIPIELFRLLKGSGCCICNIPTFAWCLKETIKGLVKIVCRIGRPGREVDQCSALVKNELSCTRTPPTSLRGVGRDNFSIYSYRAEIRIGHSPSSQTCYSLGQVSRSS
jgi:hypothetical protein